MKLTGTKLIFAHRGASAYAPENTLPAFELAADMKAFGVELDVHLTKDGVLVVTHDDEISRVSDGNGKVKDMAFEELRKFNFAAKFADKKFGDVKIPTLDEVYELLAPRGLYVNVEIKASGDEVVKKTLECAEKHGMRDKVIYSSFNHWNLTNALEHDSEAFVAPLYGSEIVKPADYAALFGAKAIHPHFWQIINHPEIVAHAKEIGVRVHPWTVDNPADIETLCSLDIDAIITNRPDVALDIANR